MGLRALIRTIRIEHLGGLLLAVWLGLHGLSGAFVYGQGHQQRPIPVLVGLLLGASVVYGAAVLLVLKRPQAVRLSMVVLFALLFRGVAFTANVIQEDDFYRYIWDGQVTLQGVNPYRYAPAHVASVPADAMRGEAAPPLQRLRTLAQGDGPASAPATIFSRINHPSVPTTYPPVAQGIFALIQQLAPWSLQGLRVGMLVFDGLCMMLLVLLLKQLHLPVVRVLIYAWSPLVVKEFVNAAHMDVIAMAGLLLTAWFAVRRRWIASGVTLALTTAAKYYPLLLAPLLMREWWRAGSRTFAAGVAAFAGTLGLCFLPFLDPRLSVFQGLSRYANDWSLNSGVFSAIRGAGGWLVGSQEAYWPARVVLAMGLVVALGVIVWRSRSPLSAAGWLGTCATVISAAFVFSPVQAPWYLGWVIPWLCVRPSMPWLVLTGLIQLYYLGFYVEYHLAGPLVTQWWHIIQAVEYVPILALFGWQLYRRRIAASPLEGAPAASRAWPRRVMSASA
jgi:hypothetical protein